jgi:thioredoxin reductase
MPSDKCSVETVRGVTSEVVADVTVDLSAVVIVDGVIIDVGGVVVTELLNGMLTQAGDMSIKTKRKMAIVSSLFFIFPSCISGLNVNQ